MRKTTNLVLVILCTFFVVSTAKAGMPRFLGGGRDTVRGGMFPGKGDVPDLVPTKKALKYREEKFKEFYGANADIYIAYGIENLVSAEYEYGGKDRRITIEMATMDDGIGSAGLFHHHRGVILKNTGEAVNVGAEGVLDVSRDGRNLYFYRSSIFVKILYSGREPVPNLMPIAQYIDAKIPKDRDERPDGFEFIRVPWADEKTIALTPGFCFSLNFMPPAVTASTPGAGSIASDLFIMTRRSNSDATDLFNDYRTYLQTFAEYIEEFRWDRQRLIRAIDPNQGRVVFTAYKNVFIIAARPDGYDKGEELIKMVMQKVDEKAAEKKRR